MDNSLNARCGGEPDEKLCMFPKMGSFHGPGGRLKEWWLLNLFPIFTTININSKKEKRVGNDKTWSSIRRNLYSTLVSYFSRLAWNVIFIANGQKGKTLIGIQPKRDKVRPQHPFPINRVFLQC
jgi:hypothetical protein